MTSSVEEIQQCISFRWKYSSLEDSWLIALSNGRAGVLDGAGNGSMSLTACIKKTVTKSCNDSFPSWMDYREA